MPSQNATVLVVEDEAFIRMDIADCLVEAGYGVVEAANADEAIGILVKHPSIRLLFTDIDMPGSMDGLKLAAAVRDRWPPVQIIIASGQREPGAGELPSGSRFFRKPYIGTEIAKAVSELLGR